jgi:hypothetical protein
VVVLQPFDGHIAATRQILPKKSCPPNTQQQRILLYSSGDRIDRIEYESSDDATAFEVGYICGISRSSFMSQLFNSSKTNISFHDGKYQRCITSKIRTTDGPPPGTGWLQSYHRRDDCPDCTTSNSRYCSGR